MTALETATTHVVHRVWKVTAPIPKDRGTYNRESNGSVHAAVTAYPASDSNRDSRVLNPVALPIGLAGRKQWRAALLALNPFTS